MMSLPGKMVAAFNRMGVKDEGEDKHAHRATHGKAAAAACAGDVKHFVDDDCGRVKRVLIDYEQNEIHQKTQLLESRLDRSEHNDRQHNRLNHLPGSHKRFLKETFLL